MAVILDVVLVHFENGRQDPRSAYTEEWEQAGEVFEADIEPYRVDNCSSDIVSDLAGDDTSLLRRGNACGAQVTTRRRR